MVNLKNDSLSFTLSNNPTASVSKFVMGNHWDGRIVEKTYDRIPLPRRYFLCMRNVSKPIEIMLEQFLFIKSTISKLIANILIQYKTMIVELF